MLHEQIKDFLIHGKGTDKNQSIAGVSEEVASLLIAHAAIILEKERQIAEMFSYKSSAVAQQQAMREAGVDARLDDFIRKELASNIMAMAHAVEQLSDLQESIDAVRMDYFETKEDLQGDGSSEGHRQHGGDSDEQQHVQIRHAQLVMQRKSIHTIPTLVLEVVSCVPLRDLTLTALPKTSCIMMQLKKTVDDLKKSIRDQFTAQFESLLTRSSDGVFSTVDTRMQDTNRSSTHMWQTFLTSSREWLLAYCLLSILPVALSETTHQVQDAYRDAVDEMLAPLWGRFRFHLQQSTGVSSAGEGGSKRQVLWTFQYCRSFVQLLVDLCQRITIPSSESESTASDGASCMEKVLQALPPLAGQQMRADACTFRLASQKFLIIKCIRFFQAHLAEVLVTAVTSHQQVQVEMHDTEGVAPHQRSTSESFILQLVECALSLDKDLSHMLVAKEYESAAADNAHTGQKLSLNLLHSSIDVFCAARPVFTAWVRADTEHVQDAVRSILMLGKGDISRTTTSISDSNSVSRSTGLFSVLFSNAFNTNLCVYLKSSNTRDDSMYCYKAPYGVMRLFLLTARRYSAIPVMTGGRVQVLFSTFILEPLLHLLVCLLLLRLRSNVALCDLSNGILPADMRQHELINKNAAMMRANASRTAKMSRRANLNSDTEREQREEADEKEEEEVKEEEEEKGTLNEKEDKNDNDDEDGEEEEEECDRSDAARHYANCPYASQVTHDLRQFYDCVAYLESALSKCSETVRSLRCSAIEVDSTTAYERKWHNIHSWLPRDLIDTAPTGEAGGAAATEQRNVLKTLHRKVLPCYDESATAEVSDEAQSNSTNVNNKHTTLGDSIDFCRAQMVKIAQVLRQQEMKAKIKLGVV